MPEQKPKDLPKDELFAKAEEVLARYGEKAEVYFKFTCTHCGQRCTLEKPNYLPKYGECFKCGQDTEIKEGGFMLMLEMRPAARVEPLSTPKKEPEK